METRGAYYQMVRRQMDVPGGELISEGVD
jgi:hypothetical protein